MKIVVDCRMISLSGIGRYIKDILPGLCENYNSVVLLGKQDELQTYIDTYKTVSVISMDTPIYSIKEQIVLPRKIPACDIFFSPHYNIPLFPIRAKMRVTTIHDAYHLAFYDKLSLPQKIYAKIFYRGALKLSDKVITISQFSKNELIRYSLPKYADKIEVIYRFVGDVTKSNIKETKQPHDTGNYFLVVGNVKPNKNLKNALLGFKEFVLANKDIAENFVLKIVGQKGGFGTNDSEIYSLIKNDEVLQQKVQFTGHVSDVELIALFQRAKALVFSSYYEGFGLPPLEAMYFGCPTLCSNAASIPEICGDASIYFNPFNPSEIAGAMLKLSVSEQLRNEIIEKGFLQEKKFTREKAIHGHLHLFAGLIKN